MTSEREPVDDAALIAEAMKNTGKSMSCWRDEIELVAREAVRLVREGWQPPAPEPDRAEVLACELWNLEETASWGERKTIIRRHFDELRAEWEAERPVIDVPEDVAKWAKHRRTQFNQGGWISNAERDACDFILQLAKGPSQ